LGLKDPVCNNEQCNALWNQIRDALEIWYVHKATPSTPPHDIEKLKTSLGVDHKGYGAIQTQKAKLKKSDPDKFGDAGKIENT
jgi:hypothetical protein